MKRISFLNVLALLSVFTLTACNEHAKEGGATQVVAKVNNEEVSIHQLNYVLTHSNNITPENAEQAKKKILTNLVDVSILTQQAMAEKLDRDPDTIIAIEQSKRQVLAQALLQKISKAIPKPTAAEVEVYYNGHPDLFSKHKTFKLREIVISKADGKQTLLSQALTTAKKADDLVKILDENKIPYQQKVIVQGAENIPLEQLPTLANLKEGEYLTFDKDNAVLVLALVSFSTENVELAKATPIIEKYLNAKTTKETIDKTLKDLKDQAKIEYIGEFASLNSEKTGNSPTITTPSNP
jgi:EpsD family peptidyl-prolyl cis-trans isomerase